MKLRSRSKATTVAPRAAVKTEPTAPTPPTASDGVDLSEAGLRKLPRAELQKLAMAHKVKANMKSELIIRQLMNLKIPKKGRPAEVDPEEGPSRKKFKGEATSEKVAISRTPENQGALPDTPPTQDIPVRTGVEGPQPQQAVSSVARSKSPAHEPPTAPSYDRDLFSSTESEMTEEEQLDYATPISSRSGTPPPANTKDLDRCVKIMQQISAQDVALLNGVTDVRTTAAKLRKRARDVRELVKAETGRRERMETYFRYWQETEPRWDRKWLYGEKMVPDYKLRLEELDGPAGPPTIPRGQNLGGHARPATPVQKQVLSPERLKQRREAIISKQEAEQRQLDALRIKQVRGENSSRERSSDSEGDDSNAEDGPSLISLPPVVERDDNGALVLSKV